MYKIDSGGEGGPKIVLYEISIISHLTYDKNIISGSSRIPTDYGNCSSTTVHLVSANKIVKNQI